jgi:hypothetical protein
MHEEDPTPTTDLSNAPRRLKTERSLRSVSKNFVTTVSAVHPVLYLIAYLLAIPLFAGLYCSLPFGFLAPYARLEYAGQSDTYEAGLIIQAALRRAMTGRSLEINDPKDNFKVRTDMIHVQRIASLDGSTVKFDLMLGLFNEKGLVQATIPLLMRAGSRVLVGSSRGDKNFRLLELGSLEHKSMLGDHRLLAAAIDQLLQPPNPNDFVGVSVDVSDEEDAALQKFFDGLAGDPTAVSGTLGRMVYFSAIVITTVGFGDIVPITSLARTAVALEAVIGIVLAGLFLNAVAFRAGGGGKSID